MTLTQRIGLIMATGGIAGLAAYELVDIVEHGFGPHLHNPNNINYYAAGLYAFGMFNTLMGSVLMLAKDGKRGKEK